MRGAIITFEQYYGLKDIGSSRIRGKWLVNYWPECEMFVLGRPYDFVIYQKVYRPEHAKAFKGIKILDVCEPDFLNWDSRKQEMLDNVDAVTCATEALAQEFRRFTSKPVVVIPDRIDFNEFPAQKVHKGRAKSAVWFGYANNFPVINRELLSVLNKLNLRLVVVADKPFAAIKVAVDNQKWNEADWQSKIMLGDIAINPRIETVPWKFKSNNKTLTAWALGLPVAADAKELERFMDADARNKEAELRRIELKEKWDVRFSVKEYKELIDRLKSAKQKNPVPKINIWQTPQIDINAFSQAAGEFMAGERGSAIARPMSPRCRVAVMIPVYNETISTVLRPLLSLAKQQRAAPEVFEVDVIVNNSRQEALEKNPAFFANQQILKFISYLNSSGQKPDPSWNADILKQAKEIKESGIRINAIDKSSLDFAENINQLVHARNRAFMEMARRFCFTGAGLEGIIATTDADCRLAPDFIERIVEIYSEYPFLNGLTGLFDHEIDPAIPYPDLVTKAFEYNIGRSVLGSADWPRGKVVLKKRDKLNYQVLSTGLHMAVPARSWILTGGLAKQVGGEDPAFGRALEELPGDVAKGDYIVYPLIRISERCGLGCYGRRIKKIARAVKDYMEKKSPKILVPNMKSQNALVRFLISSAQKQAMAPRDILAVLKSRGCDIGKIQPADLERFADVLAAQTALPPEKMDPGKLEAGFLDYLYDALPEDDITDRFGGKKWLSVN